MKGSPRKYLSEHAVSLCSARWMMTSAGQLMSNNQMSEEQKVISDRCHIYMVTTLPRLGFCPDTTRYENGNLSGHVQYRVQGELREFSFDFAFPLLDGAINARVTEYPHRSIVTLGDSGEQVRELPASAVALAPRFRIQRPELYDLEVLYVGQAFGDGDRSAFVRLRSHSTLQKILADIQSDHPDDEVYVLMFEYSPYRTLHAMNGTVKAQKSGKEDSERFYSIVENPLSEHQQICLAEAGLIRYFGPKYNKVYKDSFPSRSHKVLEGCYSLDFSGLVVEINTEKLQLSLCSGYVSPAQHHLCQVDLIADEDRQGFFCLPDGERVGHEIPDVIKGKRGVKI